MYEYIKPNSPLRQTLLFVIQFASEKSNAMGRFWLPSQTLTDLRKSKGLRAGIDSSNRHLSMLTAMGLLIRQKVSDLEGNKIFESMRDADRKRVTYFYNLPEYTPRWLEQAEERCAWLLSQGTTPSNISIAKLSTDARKYPRYDSEGHYTLPWRVWLETYRRVSADSADLSADRDSLIRTVDAQIRVYGYATKDMILSKRVDAYGVSKSKAERLYRYFQHELPELYDYHSPTKAEIAQYGLKSRAWIYTARQD